MGMAASQARLLTITARLADNELRSQTINNAKMRLATQSSQASENYINALNDATLKFSNYDASGEAVIQDLTYNALTAYSSYNTQYGLVNSSGQILVSEEEALLFSKSGGNINSYLKYHGLEYTTTYFEELGALKNDSYPEPFNNISVEDMKTYYEQYGSYENSIEVQNYEKLYGEYSKEVQDLSKGTKASIESYLLYSGNSPAITIDSTSKEINMALSGSNASALLVDFQKAFGYNKSSGNFDIANSNTYNIKKLIDNGFISESVVEELKKKIGEYTVESTNVLQADGTTQYTSNALKYTQETALVVPTAADENGNRVYVLDDGINITVDSNGKVIGMDSAEMANIYKDGESYTMLTAPAADGSLSLFEYVNGLGYKLSTTDDDGNTVDEVYQYKLKEADGVYTASEYSYFTDLNEIKGVLNSSADELLEVLENGINSENFAEFLLSMEPAQLQNYGINIDATVKGVDKTLSEILTDYATAKDAFLNNIFDSASKAQVEADLENNYTFEVTNADGTTKTLALTADILKDINFVLLYLENSQSRVGTDPNYTLTGALKQSSSFNTVIKEYLIDEMIEIYGEPKYAWVDKNDPNNTGNADAKAQWYTNLFNRMKQGYKALENGLASSSEWMEFALESGIVTLEQVDKSFNWQGLDYKSCTKITEETDDAAVTKAEAEYNRAMNDIEAKDNIYDIELKNIDTEHTSLQTEYDSIKSVISKNIDRTFKFNQSA